MAITRSPTCAAIKCCSPGGSWTTVSELPERARDEIDFTISSPFLKSKAVTFFPSNELNELKLRKRSFKDSPRPAKSNVPGPSKSMVLISPYSPPVSTTIRSPCFTNPFTSCIPQRDMSTKRVVITRSLFITFKLSLSMPCSVHPRERLPNKQYNTKCFIRPSLIFL